MRIRPVVSHVRGWFAAAAVTLVTAGLIVGEVNDTGSGAGGRGIR
jgi:hypothetical protein